MDEFKKKSTHEKIREIFCLLLLLMYDEKMHIETIGSLNKRLKPPSYICHGRRNGWMNYTGPNFCGISHEHLFSRNTLYHDLFFLQTILFLQIILYLPIILFLHTILFLKIILFLQIFFYLHIILFLQIILVFKFRKRT